MTQWVFLNFMLAILAFSSSGMFAYIQIGKIANVYTTLYTKSWRIEQLIFELQDMRINIDQQLIHHLLVQQNQLEIDESVAELQDYQKKISRIFNEIHEIIKEDLVILNQTQKAFDQLKDNANTLFLLVRDNKIEEAKNIFITYQNKLHPELNALMKKIKTYMNEEVETNHNHMLDRKGFTEKMIIFIICIFVIGAVFLSFLMSFSFLNSIRRAKLRLENSSQNLKKSALHQSASTNEQSIAITQISATMEELVTTSKEIKKNTERLVDSSDSANKRTMDGKKSLEIAVKGIEKIREHVNYVMENMTVLSEKSQQMGITLDILNELTEQTTILSYNATIEAAGAGDAGRRFAAIAEQIMKLANKAAESTKTIHMLIEDVQKSTHKTEKATRDGISAVNEGDQKIKESREHFKQIFGLISKNLEDIEQIEVAMSQQSTAIQQTNTAIHDIQKTAEDITYSAAQIESTAQEILELATGLIRI